MPFTDTPDANAARADVTIFVHGLILIRPDQTNKNCEFLVHPQTDHRFGLEVFVMKDPPNFPLLQLDKTALVGNGIDISLGNSRGVKKYKPTGTPEPKTGPFSEVLDFHRLHTSAVVVNPGALLGKITLRDGVLYSAQTRPKDAVLQRPATSGGCETRNVAPLCEIVGVSISLAGGEKLTIRWARQSFVIPDPDFPTAKYMILINNGRAIPQSIKDFQHFYHALTGVTGGKWDVFFQPPPANPTDCFMPEGTIKIPCMPAGIGT